MKRTGVLWGVLIVLLLVPMALWFYAVGNPADYFAPGVPAGQFLYVLSKLFGLLGIACLGLQFTLMLARPDANSIKRLWSVSSHRMFGILTLMMIVAHVALFVTAASLRSSHFAWTILTLRWSNGYYDAMVSVGVVAVSLLLAISVLGAKSGRAHSRLRYKYWHRVLVFLLLPLAMGHSYAIGSETSSWPVVLFYAGLCSLILLSLIRWRKIRFGTQTSV